VNAAIAQLGGKVLPKLNWSAPKVSMCLLLPCETALSCGCQMCTRCAEVVSVDAHAKKFGVTGCSMG
jgi:D123